MQINDTDIFIAIIACALGSHGLFKHFEPRRVSIHLILLVFVPSLLSLLFLGNHGMFWAAFTTFTVYLCTLSLSVVAYRLSPFHPLAKYPGPFWARVTKWWSVRNAIGGKQYLLFQRLHEEYGDVVRVGPNELSFCDVDAIGPIMGPNGMPKGPYWEGRIPPSTQMLSLIAQRNAKEHARRRRPWNRGFSSTAVKEYEGTLASRVTQFADKLEDQKGGITDLGRWISHFAYDFMGDMAFGGGTELLRDGDTQGIWNMLESSQQIAHTFGQIPWVSWYWEKIPGAAKTLKAFRSFAIQRAVIRRKEGSLKKDLFHHLIDEDCIEQLPPTMPQVLSDAGLAIVAGSDTTSTAATNVIWLLLSNPPTYSLLQQEVDKFFPPGENALETAKHVNMPYLNAVINETLRLYPALPGGSQRSPAQGSGGHAIGEHFLPEGSSACVHFYSLGRDPRYFSPMPNNFIPERWLSANERTSISSSSSILDPNNIVLNMNAFIPFSFGPANCVGKALAMMELRMVICTLMQKFEIRFAKGWDPVEYEKAHRDNLVFRKGELPVLLTPRRGN